MNATHELKGCRVTTGSIIIITIEEVVVVKVKIRIINNKSVLYASK